MNEVSPKLGFYASVVAFFTVITYGIAQVAARDHKQSAWRYSDLRGVAVHLSVAFLMAMLSPHDIVESRQRLWTSAALLFGTISVAYIALRYTLQLSVIVPRSTRLRPQFLRHPVSMIHA
jgi:hypothetical protein